MLRETTIVEATIKDLSVLRKLAIETFVETFGQDNTEEDLQEYVREALSLQRLAKEFANPASTYYFIKMAEEPLGFLKVNQGQAQTEHHLPNAFEIQRLYILKKCQGLGLGKQLFEFALDIAEQSGYDWAWLGVWEHNDKAQAFYKKYGFEKFSEHLFPVGKKIDTDWLLRKHLK